MTSPFIATVDIFAVVIAFIAYAAGTISAFTNDRIKLGSALVVAPLTIWYIIRLTILKG